MLMLSSLYSSLIYSSLDTTVAFGRNRLFQAVLIETEDQLTHRSHFRITGENMLSKGNLFNDQLLQSNACLQIKHSKIVF